MTFTGLGNNISGYLNSTNNKNTQSSEINNFLTTYMIDKNGNIFVYVTGALSKDMMKNIINQTLEEKIKNN